MREQFFDVDLAVGDELRALGLAHLREGPRRDHRHLPPQHVRADVDRDVVALADKAGGAPHLGAAHRARAAPRGCSTCRASARRTSRASDP